MPLPLAPLALAAARTVAVQVARLAASQAARQAAATAVKEGARVTGRSAARGKGWRYAARYANVAVKKGGRWAKAHAKEIDTARTVWQAAQAAQAARAGATASPKGPQRPPATPPVQGPPTPSGRYPASPPRPTPAPPRPQPPRKAPTAPRRPAWGSGVAAAALGLGGAAMLGASRAYSHTPIGRALATPGRVVHASRVAGRAAHGGIRGTIAYAGDLGRESAQAGGLTNGGVLGATSAALGRAIETTERQSPFLAKMLKFAKGLTDTVAGFDKTGEVLASVRRELAPFSGAVSIAGARLDMDRERRAYDRARATGGSAATRGTATSGG